MPTAMLHNVMPAHPHATDRPRRSTTAPARTAVRAGTSLLEVVTVLAIAAVLILVAAPRYTESLARYRVDMATRRVEADVAWARARADSKSRPYTIDFDVANGRYTIYDGLSDVAATETIVVDLTKGPYYARLRKAEFGVALDPTLVINGYGVASETGTVEVSSGTKVRAVDVEETKTESAEKPG
ncbi:MAG: hypothetical protein KDA25_02090 [Phycisphaerales bacterium]|nr:hypothetical protein [Phycisphaerales bacterium]